MSYETTNEGFTEVFKTVQPELAVILDYEPESAQDSPLIYSLLEDFERSGEGDVVEVSRRTLHRLCIAWGDNKEAERLLRVYVDAIPGAFDADPTLGGRVRYAEITAGDAGFVTIDGTEYRSLDFYSEVIEFGARG